MNNKILTTISPASPLEGALVNMSGNKTFRAEEIPQDQLKLNSDELLIPAAHFHKVLPQFTHFLLKIHGNFFETFFKCPSQEYHHPFGIPFYFRIKAVNKTLYSNNHVGLFFCANSSSCFLRTRASWKLKIESRKFWTCLIRNLRRWVSFFRLIDWSTDWLMGRSSDWLIDLWNFLIDRLIDWLMDGLVDGLIDSLIDWLIDLSNWVWFFIYFAFCIWYLTFNFQYKSFSRGVSDIVPVFFICVFLVQILHPPYWKTALHGRWRLSVSAEHFESPKCLL